MLFWTDNSDNEDGFRIIIDLWDDSGDGPTVLTFEVGPNVTSFELPTEAVRLQCWPRGITSVTYRVQAFNVYGNSPRTGGFGSTCPPVDGINLPTPQTFPRTGSGAADGGSSPSVWPALLAIGAAFLALGAISRRMVRARG